MWAAAENRSPWRMITAVPAVIADPVSSIPYEAVADQPHSIRGRIALRRRRPRRPQVPATLHPCQWTTPERGTIAGHTAVPPQPRRPRRRRPRLARRWLCRIHHPFFPLPILSLVSMNYITHSIPPPITGTTTNSSSNCSTTANNLPSVIVISWGGCNNSNNSRSRRTYPYKVVTTAVRTPPLTTHNNNNNNTFSKS